MSRPPPNATRASHARAIAKAATWRITGTIDTFIWSMVVTGHPLTAGSIAGLETFTKIGLFYLHERAWRWVPLAPDSHLRSLSKAVSWRVLGTLDTFILSFLVTGSAHSAVSIAAIDALTKIVLYYLHERLWRCVPYGRLESAPAARGSGRPRRDHAPKDRQLL